jgi:hydroxymethylbilane synthase
VTRRLRLATRGSPLALWQARHVAAKLREAHPGLRCELVIVVSTGDADRNTPLYGMGNIGVFSKEVHAAVLAGDADVGVHSCKDLPTTTPEGIVPVALLARADCRDALIGAQRIQDLPQGALVGTSSLRRQSQLAALRPDLRFEPIRGNVGTRIRKVQDGEYQATLMAMAGLHRLGLLRHAAAVPLHPIFECTPAPAQGAVAVDCRANDFGSASLLACLHHHETATAVEVEREMLQGLRGGCSLPFGCLVRRDRDARWHLHACLADDQGSLQRVHVSGGVSTDLAQRALTALKR